MGEAEVGAALRDTMMVVVKLGGPVLIAALVVGVAMSLVQAITQVNEATLAFVPKMLVVVATLMLTGPFMLSTLTGYTQSLFDRMIAVGGL